MTLSLRIKHMGPDCHSAEVKRDGATVAHLQASGEEAEVAVWQGAKLEIVEHAKPRKSEH